MDKTTILTEYLKECGYTTNRRTDAGKLMDSEFDIVFADEPEEEDRVVMELIRLGWVTWFDAEGNFFKNNEHSQVVKYALSGIGVDAHVTDTWVSDKHISMQVEINGTTKTMEAFPEFKSDYCENDLLINALIESMGMIPEKFTCAIYETRDQTMCILLLPDDVAHFVQDLDIIPLTIYS